MATCPECPHCREIAERADLRLSSTVPRSMPGGVDRAFYREFAAVYAVARARGTRPVQLLCEVNPQLTPSRCKDYLKRARALGFVSTPARGDGPHAPVAGPSPAEQQDVDEPVEALDDAAIMARTRRLLAGRRVEFDPTLA